MADYEADIPLQESPDWELYHLSECLEDHSIRHCLAGDAIIATLGYPLVICSLYLAVADEQLEDALTIFLQKGFQKTKGHDCYVDGDATENPLGWPGYNLSMPSAPPMASNLMLVPSSLWHMELSASSLSANTFLHPTTRCRFPKRWFYLDALIDAVVEEVLKPGHNQHLYGYFNMQYHYLIACLSRDTPLSLPPEDQFFIDLWGRQLPPSTRPKVCFNRQQIRRGLMTVEEAQKVISRKFLDKADAIWRKSRRQG